MSEPTKAEIDYDLTFETPFDPNDDSSAEYGNNTVRAAYLVGWRAGREGIDEAQQVLRDARIVARAWLYSEERDAAEEAALRIIHG